MREALAGRGVVRQGVLRRGVLGLSACALTALVYLPFVDNPFVLDDRDTVLLNPSLVNLGDWRGILLSDPWHSLVNASFAIDRAFGGISTLGFHLTNTILHVLAVALLFTLASRPLGSQSSFEAAGGRTWAAFVAAAAFGVNPLTARTVAYVSARADLLFATSALLAGMLAWGAARSRSVARFALAAAVAILSLTAIPLGGPAVHGPPRCYLTIALVLLASARAIDGAFARSRAARIMGVLAVAALAFMTKPTLTAWADPVGLWRAQVARTPEAWDTHLGYADALREASRCADAAAEYETVLRARPDQPEARRGLARCR